MVKKKDGRKNNGGHDGVGRKPYDDETQKKVPVQVYIKQVEVDLLGGKEAARSVALIALQKEINKKIKK